MPIIKSAIKRAKQTIKRRERNVEIKHGIKSAVNVFVAKPSNKALSAAYSELDKAVKKGLIKKNTAARRKAQLSKIAKKVKVSNTPVKKAAIKPAKTTAKKTTTKKPAAKKLQQKK